MPKFVPRQRKHKARRKVGDHGHQSSVAAESNVAEILPVSATEKEERKRQLREQLRAQQPKMSGKKQKRLDKYIDTKMRKEENLQLMKKLALSKVDTSLYQSSRKLGIVNESRRDILSRALREHEAGINVKDNEALLLTERDVRDYNSNSEDGTSPDIPSQPLHQPLLPLQAVAGSGLKRPLDLGEDGFPAIATKRRKRKGISAGPIMMEQAWEGICSEDGSEPDGELLSSDDFSSGVESEASEASGISSSVASEDEDETSESSMDEEGIQESRKERTSAFKAWANQQRNEALGFTPSARPDTDPPPEYDLKPRPPDVDPLPQELRLSTDMTRKAYHVEIQRSPETASARLALPVVGEEQKIMEAIHNNPVVVIWGATGSGKTTQIPQFLYEAGYGSPDGPTPGMIGVTQPRRVAAVSMARRVGDEMGTISDRVAYKIRFEGSVNNKTVIKFMTDGILLREASEDITLRKYSAIVIDEAHERTKDTDILIGMMSRIIRLRQDLGKEDPSVKPLKLIIMSATLRVTDFTGNARLFQPVPPVVQAEGRQYPVTVHWARKTIPDYLEEAYRKISKAHRRLPPGGILFFLTGQNEITHLSRRLREAFPQKGSSKVSSGPSVQISGMEAPIEAEDMDLGAMEGTSHDEPGPANDEEMFDSDSDSGSEDQFNIDQGAATDSAMHVLPLYSLLPTKDQLRVFEATPSGCRMVVLATNVAETSLTIPGIRYVFDCGRAKERHFDDATGVQGFEIGWISKASASQRAGRAGRTGPGHCYRLYSSAVYERDFVEHAQPEILRTPIEGLVLQLSSLNIPNIVNKFPFPTPPDPLRLQTAQKLLSCIGALSSDGGLTTLGKQMANFPLAPRFSKMLLTGHQYSALPYTIALVAALSVHDIFIPEPQINPSPSQARSTSLDSDKIFTNADRLEQDAQEARRKAYNKAHLELSALGGTSDAIKLLSAVVGHANSLDPDSYCQSHFLRHNALREAQLLRRQLTNLLRADPFYLNLLGPFEIRVTPPTEKQVKYLKQVIASGYIDQVAILAESAPNPPEQARKPRRPIDVPYLPLFPSHLNKQDDASVYGHPSSILRHLSLNEMPTYIIYSHLQRSAGSQKVRMLPLTPIGSKALARLAKESPVLEYGKPLKEAVTLEDGRRECWVVPMLRGRAGSLGWPLPAVKVVQRKVKGQWVVEGNCR
ncbi:MAG: putative ATP-dependent RNA helicase DHR1 [Caeruleum heppii]|nr:MAG: putative ATP-dependent RNA helicase DHR1 [Caeruleum heppii]